MLQIALLLMGANFLRKAAPFLAVIGVLWGVLGLSIFLDGMEGMRYFPFHVFGILLLIESLITLLLAGSAKGAQKSVFYFKGGIFCFIAILILSGRESSNLLLAILFGFAFFITGLFVMASAWVVRYENWRRVFLGGLAQLAFALFLFLPYPTHHHGTISQFLGVIMILGSIQCLSLARRAFRLREGVSSELRNDAPAAGPLIVHVWTPEGSSGKSPIPRPVINRYIAAVDIDGVISTGHAALEMSPDVYISLYPAVDIDRSPSEFFNTLKAIQENNVPGQFQPSYQQEAAAWCDSDRKIIFQHYNASALRRYWENYREVNTYNLTWRNCSSSVAYGLEAALEGILSDGRGGLHFIRLFFMPELWIAAQLRKRATTMAWTPGLMLDYARALHVLVHPREHSWMQRWKQQLDRTG
ncbi:HdeD family acid-resistance protein [Scandinavium lactucae]|uniref:Tripartite tricarboxylate transporter TctB family protein n=1 Tax=Scandinavium lactucae TaxID=3095028 RepID=A0ABU4QUX3_9ENTR|nr:MULTISPECIES: tripartite tricarboxylate transporter TctB family protein [unclassified Scandinavium]MDX6042772.1 tripartite tricarboxylate transporter TctB family protein [Scandinavium sp. V105_6]MDX6052773.1 tripartite tricarboxylate transporter TctB family protein [Scandinavium sp. V105_1]